MQQHGPIGQLANSSSSSSQAAVALLLRPNHQTHGQLQQQLH
jgi:alpha/beta superfamily hydrolase